MGHRKLFSKVKPIGPANIMMEQAERPIKFPTFSELYSKVSSLGRGAFGRVYQCINLSTYRECAVKVLPKAELSLDMIPEFSIMSELNNPHIVKLHSVTETEDQILFEMELLKGGSLKELLKRQSLRPEDASRVMLGILKGVCYLHEKNIVHRDLKPENILFKEKGNLDSVKIADFGLSTQIDSDNYYNCLSSNAGTVIFMAPEQGQNRYYSKPVDMWSIGMILYMMITGTHPFYREGDKSETYFDRLNSASIDFPESFPPLAANLCIHLTKVLPLERYSAKQALDHPFITRINEGEIPLTAMERMRMFNDEQKLWRIMLAMMFMASQKKIATPSLAKPPSHLSILDPRTRLTISNKHTKRFSMHHLKPPNLKEEGRMRLNSVGITRVKTPSPRTGGSRTLLPRLARSPIPNYRASRL